MSQQLSLQKDKIRFLLLEGVHQNALDVLHAAGYTNIDYRKTALDEDALIEAIRVRFRKPNYKFTHSLAGTTDSSIVKEVVTDIKGRCTSADARPAADGPTGRPCR